MAQVGAWGGILSRLRLRAVVSLYNYKSATACGFRTWMFAWYSGER